MSFALVDDDFFSHPKVVRAGGDAALLYIAGLCYCNKYFTDGKVPTSMVPRLTDRKNAAKLAERLVNCGNPDDPEEKGLWERDGADFLVHDYHDINRDAEVARSRKDQAIEKKRIAGKIGGKKSAEIRASKREAERQASGQADASSKPQANGQANGQQTGWHNSSPTPTPTPTPLPERERLSLMGGKKLTGDAFAQIWMDTTKGKPAGNPEDCRQAAALIAEAASHRGEDPPGLARRLVVAHLADLEAAAKEGRVFSPTVFNFAIGPQRSPGSWLSQAFDRLDGKSANLDGEDSGTDEQYPDVDEVIRRAKAQPQGVQT